MSKRGNDDDEKIKWSWVGNRSPLMGEREGAEWVLDRLTKTLEREREAIRREELEMKGDRGNQKGDNGEGDRSESSGTLLEENKSD